MSDTLPTVKRNGMIGDVSIRITSMDELYKWSQWIIASNMAPPSYRKPEQVIMALQYGAEIGLNHMQALGAVAVINGKATLYGDALPALAWSSGILEEFEEWLEGEGDGLVAFCRTKRKGQEKPRVTTFSVADAKRAGLWGKSGPWTQYPQRMLQMRARSWNFRDNLADVLKGFHVREEVIDEPRRYEALPMEEVPAMMEQPADADPLLNKPINF